ncbi:hypothetical protein KDK_10400 [Dictyobacter kobayashii]|uniref:Uncharacterized protein n=1 Tax=Dictyobacter kobayashii TaxID=2014872 RepID=A0A402ADQ7_9CHLR|nr:hypothetical protein KDK_10400 [Dictyobacter kobayashii]
MLVLSIITAAAYIDTANVENMRILLFVLLIIAICLILAGAIIALLTLYSSRKAHSTNPDRLPGE